MQNAPTQNGAVRATSISSVKVGVKVINHLPRQLNEFNFKSQLKQHLILLNKLA